MKISKEQLGNFDKGFELWIGTDNGSQFYHFDGVYEAFVYYLDKFAEVSEMDYYQQLTGKNIYDITDRDTIFSIFQNVFNEKHHIYEVIRRADGQVIRI